MANGPLVTALELLFDDERAQGDPNRMGRMAIIDELLGILFLSNIPGNQCCKLDPFVFGIQLAERKIIVIQRHLMVLRIHGTALQMHGFLPFSQVYRVFIIPYNVWKCCIFNEFWVPEWTLNNSYFDKNADSRQRVAVGILSGGFLADIG